MTFNYKLFTMPRCHRCPAARDVIKTYAKISGDSIDCGRPENMIIAQKYKVQKVPTLIIYDEDVETKRVTEINDMVEVLTELKTK